MTITHELVEIKKDGKGKESVVGVAATLVKFFGKKDGQSLSDFAAEVKGLTLDDQIQLVGGIRDGSLTY